MAICSTWSTMIHFVSSECGQKSAPSKMPRLVILNDAVAGIAGTEQRTHELMDTVCNTFNFDHLNVSQAMLRSVYLQTAEAVQ